MLRKSDVNIPKISADKFANQLISHNGVIRAFEIVQSCVDGLTYSGTDKDNMTFRMSNLDPRGQFSLKFYRHTANVIKKRLPETYLAQFNEWVEEKRTITIDRLKAQQIVDDRRAKKTA